MKKRLLKIIGLSSMAFFTILAISPVSARAQKAVGDTGSENKTELLASVGKGARAIEGTWNAVVTIRNCQTGNPITTFRAMDMFIQGGSVMDTNAAPPNTRGPGFGSWEYVADHGFTSTIRFFLYNPDGSFAGVRRIAQEIQVNEANDGWDSTVAITVFDPAGNQVATACATAVGTRAE